ncbi:S9 family peptidase [Runella sp.]|jgi:dipeptidyl aminopeptidase/acylaminoacyl peptidase|uniref:S9 family peptidase n=1 Tax=Runella sp. TaxID=1960881 RepID=UPI00260B9574|nr:S9 family peptidase [Runella sp.]
MRILFLLLSAFLCATAFAQAPSIQQSLSMKSVGSPRISPDGKWVAYTVSETNWEENAYETEIWLANVGTGEKFQLTNSKKSNSSPVWAPDGKTLAFLSTRDDKSQIYIINPQGGEAKVLTKFETGVSYFEFSPDGKSIVFAATVPDSKAFKDRVEKYSDYEVVHEDYKMTHLYSFPISDTDSKIPTPKALTKGVDYSVGSFSISPDGKKIAFDATKDPDLINGHTADIYVLTLADSTTRKIVSLKGPDNSPIWSPDGKQIAFATTNQNEFYFYANRLIATVPAEGGVPVVLSQSFDENANLLKWSAEGIWFAGFQKTASHLFLLNPDNKQITKITKPDNVVASQFSFSTDFKQTAFVMASPNRMAEIMVRDLANSTIASSDKSIKKPGKTPKAITSIADSPKNLTQMSDQLKPFKTSNREVISWKSSDGTVIEGILIKPVNFDSIKKYPLLVVIHGGPTGIDLPTVVADRIYPVEQFAAKGALVLRPNYRGSAGYGSAFRALNVRNLGVGDYADVISGVDFLIGKGWVDKDKVGAMGWSQGGYISAFITTFSDRFKATSVGAGISNWATYYQNTDITPFTRQYLKGTPWNDPEIYQKTSPISYIKTAKTPTLIQHGELDKRVPIANAYELRLALEDNNVPVKMVVYKGFGHGITKPKQMRQVMEENWQWFGKWVFGEESTH